MDVLNNIFATDNIGWMHTERRDVLRPYSFLNFGDPDLAPWVDYDVTPRADFSKNAAALQAFGTAVQTMASGGATFTDEAEVREFAHKQLGLAGLPKMKLTNPVDVAAKAAASDHKDKPGGSLK